MKVSVEPVRGFAFNPEEGTSESLARGVVTFPQARLYVDAARGDTEALERRLSRAELFTADDLRVLQRAGRNLAAACAIELERRGQ